MPPSISGVNLGYELRKRRRVLKFLSSHSNLWFQLKNTAINSSKSSWEAQACFDKESPSFLLLDAKTGEMAMSAKRSLFTVHPSDMKPHSLVAGS